MVPPASRKFTAPVGVPPGPVTVAVNVSVVPNTDGFGPAVRTSVVVVDAGTTVTVTVAVVLVPAAFVTVSVNVVVVVSVPVENEPPENTAPTPLSITPVPPENVADNVVLVPFVIVA